MATDKAKNIDDLNWENRRLCFDGNCIGVIGADNNCKECGKPAGSEGAADLFSGCVEDEKHDDGDGGIISEDDKSDEPDLEWKNRRLCSDGSCIGVIGADNNCKECGKPARD